MHNRRPMGYLRLVVGARWHAWPVRRGRLVGFTLEGRGIAARGCLLLGIVALLALGSVGAESSSAALTEGSFFEKTEARPGLAASGEVLSWNAVDPSGAYLLRRTTAGREPEYVLIKATHARPPAIPEANAGYRVRALLGTNWSPEVSLSYPAVTEPLTLGPL